MPLYEYQCETCGRVTEVFAKSAEEDLAPQTCGCGKDAHFVKLYSSFAAHASQTPEFAGCGREGCGGGACGRHMPDD